MVGSSGNITAEDQPSSELGIFVSPEEVSCNGRIVSLDVCGFFMSEDNTSDFLAFAAVLSPSGDKLRIDTERIPVKRNNFTASYICFSRKLRNSFNVKKGNRIGVATMNECKKNVCPFLPVVNSTESADIILYRPSFIETFVSPNSFQNRTNMTIHFRAHINLPG